MDVGQQQTNNKKTASAARNAHERAKRLEEMEQKRTELERLRHLVFDAIAILAEEDELSEETILEQLQFLDQESWSNVAEERALGRVCGVPLCSSALTSGQVFGQQLYRISASTNQVMDNSVRKWFCTDLCYGRFAYIREQLPPYSLWITGSRKEKLTVRLNRSGNLPVPSVIHQPHDHVEIESFAHQDVTNGMSTVEEMESANGNGPIKAADNKATKQSREQPKAGESLSSKEFSNPATKEECSRPPTQPPLTAELSTKTPAESTESGQSSSSAPDRLVAAGKPESSSRIANQSPPNIMYPADSHQCQQQQQQQSPPTIKSKLPMGVKEEEEEECEENAVMDDVDIIQKLHQMTIGTVKDDLRRKNNHSGNVRMIDALPNMSEAQKEHVYRQSKD